MGVISSKLPVVLHKRKESLNEDCPICLCEVEEKSLACGHKVHLDCLIMQIQHGKSNEEDHLSFNYICCPLCRQILNSSKLKTILKPIKQLKSMTDKIAISSLEKFALDVLGETAKEPVKVIKKMKKQEKIELAYRKLVFYRCKDCSKPYCGGAASCAQVEQEVQEKKKKTRIVRRKKQNGMLINAPLLDPLPQNGIPLPPPPPPFDIKNNFYVPLYPFHYAKNKQNIIDQNQIIDNNYQLDKEEDEEYFDSPLFKLFSEIPLPPPPFVVNINRDVPLLCSIKLDEEKEIQGEELEEKEEEEKEEEKEEEEDDEYDTDDSDYCAFEEDDEEYFDSPLFILFSEIPLPPPPPPFVVNNFYINQNNNINQLNALRNSRVDDVIEIENHNINDNIGDEGDESEYEEVEEEVDDDDDDDDENEDGDIERKGRYCLDCSTVKVKRNCKHPVTDLIFKCVACCSPATFYCGATNFYCNHCHSNLHSFKTCEGPLKCPLGISHPPNQCGTHGGGVNAIPFALGCAVCGPVRKKFDPLASNSQFNALYY